MITKEEKYQLAREVSAFLPSGWGSVKITFQHRTPVLIETTETEKPKTYVVLFGSVNSAGEVSDLGRIIDGNPNTYAVLPPKTSVTVSGAPARALKSLMLQVRSADNNYTGTPYPEVVSYSTNGRDFLPLRSDSVVLPVSDPSKITVRFVNRSEENDLYVYEAYMVGSAE
jgi:hypothetical protein